MIGTSCIVGRAPSIKETLPDFHEWCRVTRHPIIFCGLTGCQQTPREMGRHSYSIGNVFVFALVIDYIVKVKASSGTSGAPQIDSP